MTQIYRKFNADTRSITHTEKSYAGQVCDSISTTLNISYEPIGFLHDGGYIPYIIFSVYDEAGAPYTYSPDSTPKFDGYKFDIPWEVTSKVKTSRLEYQLMYVAPNIEYKGDIAQLQDTQYILSSIDCINLKPSITCKCKQECAPINPSTSPSIAGWIELWKEEGMVRPVSVEQDPETGHCILVFHTYSGNEQMIEFDTLVLGEDGKIKTSQLPLITKFFDDEQHPLYKDSNIPSSKLVYEELDKKVNKGEESGFQSILQKGQANGYAGLDENTKLLLTNIPTGKVANTLPLIKGTILDDQLLKWDETIGGFVGYTVQQVEGVKAVVYDIVADGNTRVFEVSHTLGKYPVSVEVSDSEGHVIEVDCIKNNAKLTFTFSKAPAIGTTYKVTICG